MFGDIWFLPGPLAFEPRHLLLARTGKITMQRLVAILLSLAATMGLSKAAQSSPPDWAYAIPPPGVAPPVHDDGKLLSLPGSNRHFTRSKINGYRDDDTQSGSPRPIGIPAIIPICRKSWPRVTTQERSSPARYVIFRTAGGVPKMPMSPDCHPSISFNNCTICEPGCGRAPSRGKPTPS